MNSVGGSGKPIVSQDGNQLEVQFDKSVTHSKLSNSKDLRPWAEKYQTSPKLVDALAFISVVIPGTLALLNLAWILIPFEPGYHAAIKTLLYISVFGSTIAAFYGIKSNLGQKHIPSWVQRCGCFVVGVVFAFYLHSL